MLFRCSSTLSSGAAELEACAGADPKARHPSFRCARILQSVAHAFGRHMACMMLSGHSQVSQGAGMLFIRMLSNAVVGSSGAGGMRRFEGSTSVISVRACVKNRGVCNLALPGWHDAPWPHASIAVSWHAVQMLFNAVAGSCGAGGMRRR